MSDVVWLVGQTEDLGDIQEALRAADATVQETWPAGPNAGLVALVRASGAAAKAAAEALDGDVQRFDDEAEARRNAAQLASSA